MKIKCECGNIICEGEIKLSKKGRKAFDIKGNTLGEIHTNKSRNPKDWTGVCSKCQSSEKG